MGAFEDRMRMAKNARNAVRDNAMADFDKVIARAAEVDAKRIDATTAHLVALDSDAAAFEGMVASLDEYSNSAGEKESAVPHKTEVPRAAWEPPNKD